MKADEIDGLILAGYAAAVAKDRESRGMGSLCLHDVTHMVSMSRVLAEALVSMRYDLDAPWHRYLANWDKHWRKEEAHSEEFHKSWGAIQEAEEAVLQEAYKLALGDGTAICVVEAVTRARAAHKEHDKRFPKPWTQEDSDANSN